MNNNPSSSAIIPIAVVGATGFAGETTLRILLNHPHAQLVHVGSDRLAGTAIGDAVPSLKGECDLELAVDTAAQIRASGAQAVILCKKSPEVTPLVPQLLAEGLKVIDIGAEFRLRSLADYQRWYTGEHACPELLPEAIYGLSEYHTDAIRQARVVGNPGCYTTSILLPLLPLLREQLIQLNSPIVAVGYSGLSGAGKQFLAGNNNLFYAVNENLHSYKALAHQHQGELNQEMSAAAGAQVACRFVPHLAPINRGILSTISAQLKPGVTQDDISSCWQQQYAQAPFIRIREQCQAVEVAHVNGTNTVTLLLRLMRIA